MKSKAELEFMQLLSQAVRDRLGAGTSVRIHHVKKNNDIELDGITILQQGQNIAPAVYLEPYYEQYRGGEPILHIADRVIEVSREFAVDSLEDPAEAISFSRIRERLRFKLINYEMNRKLLRSVPHVSILDLAKVYYYKMEIPGVEHATVLVKRRDLTRWNVTECELAEIAAHNMREQERTELLVLREGGAVMVPWEADEDCLRGDGDDLCGDSPLLVLTNRAKLFGAACLLLDDVLYRVAERLRSDLFVLPSSIHEVLLTPDDGRMARDELEVLVRRVNQTDVPPTDVLSNHVYRYSREKGLRM